MLSRVKMKLWMLALPLALAACGPSAPPQDQGPTVTRADWSWLNRESYNNLVKSGMDPEKAERAVNDMIIESGRPSPGAAAREAQRQADRETLIRSACKNDPGLSYC